MKISFNAPVVLIFVTIAALELLLSALTGGAIDRYFVSPGSANIVAGTLFPGGLLHIFGHENFRHFAGNMTFILLLGPILEEKYGSTQLLIMIMVTAVLTAGVNLFLFSSGIIGASGIVFMMIVLASLTNVKSGSLPVTFILVMIVYVGGEFYDISSKNNVSQFAHIFGGCMGGIFGFIFPHRVNTA